ncbi:MAG: hypothetical protein LBV42_03595 [Methanobrevibacter sp.]|jgi:hypothetical protein|nr:hypothetical protein [Methanobrevibacter sp.]
MLLSIGLVLFSFTYTPNTDRYLSTTAGYIDVTFYNDGSDYLDGDHYIFSLKDAPAPEPPEQFILFFLFGVYL